MWYGFPGSCSPTQTADPSAPHLLPFSLLVLFQAPDLLQEPASLLPQAHDLLVSILVVLSPGTSGDSTLGEVSKVAPPYPRLPPSLTGMGVQAGGWGAFLFLGAPRFSWLDTEFWCGHRGR